MANFLAILIPIVYICIVVYLISLASRFVNAMERIANKIEKSEKI